MKLGSLKLGFRFFILIAGLSALSASAPAANLDMLSISGQARTRFQFDNNPGGVDMSSVDFLLNRARLNFDITPSKNLQIRFTPQFTNIYGTQDVTKQYTGGGNFTAHEAWMSYAPNDSVNVFVGRQVLSYGNELLIGANDWFREGNNFDAIRARVKYGLGTTDVIWSKLAGRSIMKKADADLLGFYSVLAVDQPFIKTSDVYVFWYDDRLGGARQRFAVLGTRLAGGVKMLDYNFEMTGEFGQAFDNDLKGVQLDATLGSKILDIHHIAINAAYANSEYNQLFPSTHKFFGESDVVQKRNNLVAFSILTDWKWGEKITSAVNGYYLMAAKDSLGTAGGRPIAGGKSSLGLEADLNATYTPEKNISFTAGYNIFKPLSGYSDAAGHGADGRVSVSQADLVGAEGAVVHGTQNGVYVQGTLSF